ncbi:MAG: LysM peptidoglycan-binding domain-containing protein [Planctomycetota bacterium]
MGQLERYGLYILCVVIFLILGVALWGGDPAVAGARANPPAVARGLDVPANEDAPTSALTANLPATPPVAERDDAVARLREQFVGSSASDVLPAPADDRSAPLETLAGLGNVVTTPAASTPAVADGRTVEYSIKKGDTLEEIAQAHFGKKSAWKQILDANPGLRPTNLRVGATIKLPSRGAAEAGEGSTTAAAADEYVIKPGDNLESIAQAKLGKRTLWREIEAINPGLKPNALRPGARIKIPAKR